jgi:hypothetical protein
VKQLTTLLPLSRSESGWFTRLPNNYPDIYSTNQFLKIADRLGVSITNGQQTVVTVREELASDFQHGYYDTLSNEEEVCVRDYYNSIFSVVLLDQPVKNTCSVAEAILRFETNDGSYRFTRLRDDPEPAESGQTVSTEYAVYSLAQLGHRDSISEATRQWVTEEWERETSGEQPDLSALQSLLRIKRILDPASELSAGVRESIRENINLKSKTNDVSPILVDQIEYFLREGIVEADELHQKLPEQIRSNQLPERGYNIAGKQFPEPHGTAVHLGALQELGTVIDETWPQNFVSRYELQSGGFAETYATETALDASLYDARLSRSLGVTHDADVPPKNTMQRLLVKNPENLKPLFKVVRICGTTAGARVKNTVNAVVDSLLSDQDLTLEQIYYLTELAQEIGYSFDADTKEAILDVIRAVRNPDGGYGVGDSTQQETFRAVRVMSNVERVESAQATVDWVEQTRVDSIGYGVEVQGDMMGPYLHNTFLCTSIIADLGYEVTEPGAIREFVLNHGSENGGFCSRVEDQRQFGTRTVEYSYWAIKTLENVDSLNRERE